MFHFRHTSGEQVFVKRPEGYDEQHGWTLVSDKARPPRRKPDHHAKFRSMDSAQLAGALLAEIEALREQVVKLGGVTTGAKKSK
jgi:hypothetical protein